MAALNPNHYLLGKARDGWERVAFYQEPHFYFNIYSIYFESNTYHTEGGLARLLATVLYKL